jgi:hypothetical protein
MVRAGGAGALGGLSTKAFDTLTDARLLICTKRGSEYGR